MSKPGNARSWGCCLACIYIYMYVCVYISVRLCMCVRAVKKNEMCRLSCSPAVFAFRRLLCIHGQPPRAFSLFYFFPPFFPSFVTARERRKTRGWWWEEGGGGCLGERSAEGPALPKSLSAGLRYIRVLFASIQLQDKDLLRRKLLVTNPYHPQRAHTHTAC